MKSKEGGGMPLTNLVPRQYLYNDSETRNQILIQFECVCVFTCMYVGGVHVYICVHVCRARG